MNLSSRNKIKAEGSMSSMTDLVFLLLIFFIILSTRVVNGEEVNLPQTSGKPSPHMGVTLTITKDLRYQINSKSVEEDQVEKRLEAHFYGKDPQECSITLNVDKDVPTGNTIEFLGMAREHDWGVTVATSTKK